MGRRGPAQTPTAILAARGSWLAKTRQDEPIAAGAPLRPAWLTGAAEIEAWNFVCPLIAGMNVAGAADTNAIARYCRLFARWRECEDFVTKHGMTDENFKEYPQVGRAARLADQLLKLEQQFGMTPSARAAMAVRTDGKAKQDKGKSKYFGPKLAG